MRRTASIEEKFELIASGHGIAVVPRRVAEAYSRPDLVYRQVMDTEPVETCIAVAENRRERRVRDFVEIAAAVGIFLAVNTLTMDLIASALGDGARWRLIELLAERPRSVGELAEMTGLRQPQTTKHLRTLAQAGLVTVFPLGQRRVYAIETRPLAALARRLRDLADIAEAHAGERDVITRYRAAIDAESALAERGRWADGRAFSFERVLSAPPEVVWRYWVDRDLLASWWAPSSMTVTDCVLEPEPQGRAILDYRDAEGRRYRSAGRVRAAREPESLEFDLSVFGEAGEILFTGHYDVALAATEEGTALWLGLTITETEVEAVPYIAGIDTGWHQVLDNLASAVGADGRDRTGLDNEKSDNEKEVRR
ncbi:hypothetical protein GCM10011588_71880 [Nocardia jinanensis]|uniref:HTH arsR-type domain-containing protein n=1 Tax=Nocardia jinanensis TaxID=382504 RepID=A0A917RYR7_9NOCA|nr:metalloregulator ArsR/SmtB family transcription factor [Nocardia jinanensis]GGL46644.1 hypothetical protein GCM10011588_71880 [Nocardia jinanensis]